MLVFFGFTSCPDVCPTSLQKVSTALEKLGGDADKLRVAFITIDPERDTVERMKRYHEAFDPRIVMLTGTPKQIAKVAKEYRVYYAKRKQGDGPDDYTMDHSAFLYLMDRDGQYVAHYAPNIPADKLAAAVRKHF
jgi:protein SCO1/2